MTNSPPDENQCACGKIFFSLEALRSHQNSCGDISTPDQPGQSTEQAEQDMMSEGGAASIEYKCDCGEIRSSQEALDEHEKNCRG
jgi:hypothetical protein